MALPEITQKCWRQSRRIRRHICKQSISGLGSSRLFWLWEVHREDQDLIREMSNFVAVAFEVFLSTVEALLLAKTAADVGFRMANIGVEKFIVREHIPTVSEDLGFNDQDVLRDLAADALYTDKIMKFKGIGSRASVTFMRNFGESV